MSENSLASVLRRARTAFSASGIATADLDARLIVEHFSGTARADAIINPDLDLSAGAVEEIETAIVRRRSGEPIHRILGYREFYGLKLDLSPETLEPRPDTETLVDAVLPRVRQIVEAKGKCGILDLGTGTGAIALALLHQVSGVEAVGTDISQGALDTARANARRLGLESCFSTRHGSWFEKIEGEFDVIVSNPPYIKRADMKVLGREVRDFDPIVALDGGEEGLDAYQAIAAGAARHLAPEGLVAVEIGWDQAADVCEIFVQKGFFCGQKHVDLGAKDRVLVFMRA